MILADTPDDEEAAALEELREVQKADFEEILEAMDGLPVTVRLLDPPLHEFLPAHRGAGDQGGHRRPRPTRRRSCSTAARSWHELNPMLGTRGVRLGVVKPGLYAHAGAGPDGGGRRARRRRAASPIVEIMIPLTVTREELALARRWVEDGHRRGHGRATKKPTVVRSAR